MIQSGSEAKRRVVLIIDRLGTAQAGTENQLLKIIDGLDPQRYDLHLVCFEDQQWFSENRQALKCRTYLVEINEFKRPWTFIKTLINVVRLVGLLRRLSPDIVHTFFPVANILGVIAARLAGIRNVVSSRRDYGEWMRADYVLATRFANVFVKRILANAPRVRDLTLKTEKVAPDRVDVIFNGIDVSEYCLAAPDPQIRAELGLAERSRVVGIVANFRPMKRHDTFVKAAKVIQSHRDDVEFLLIGTNAVQEPLRERIEALADELGVRKKLHFLGKRKDVLRILSIMDVGVNCSQGEGLSNAIIEYMATGVPCVVSDSGGNPDLVTKNIHGAVFPLGDADALAAEVMRLLDDEPRRTRLRLAARKRIEMEMSLPAMLANVDQYYGYIIDGSIAPWRVPIAGTSMYK